MHLLKKISFRATLSTLTLLITFLTAQLAFSQAKTDKIMTRDELRTCMKTKQSHDVEAAAIKRDQDSFARDYDGLKTEQAAVVAANEESRARSAALTAERNAIVTRTDELRARAETAKTDAEKADYETERTKLIERNRLHEIESAKFNEAQNALRARVDALNARIATINERSKTVNDRVEPLQKRVADWRDQCGNRRFKEDDEILIKKELAAAK